MIRAGKSHTGAARRVVALATFAVALVAGGAVAPRIALGQGKESAGSAVARGALERATLEKVIKRQVLPNGLEVIVLENHGVPLATIEIDVKNGAFTQAPGYEGLAHMYEHMFFKANADLPEPEAFVDRAGELGAIYNGTTTEERVNYYLTIPADSLRGGIEFIASALRSPLFRQDELERERQVVLGEYDRAESNPFLALTNETGKVLWGSAWSRKDALGERAAILATTPDKLRAIQKKYYVPNNSALIVAGDVNPDSVFKAARDAFGDWPRSPDPFVADPIPPVPPLARSRGLVIEAPINTVIVLEQWQGPSVGTDPQATYAADVFSDVLTQPNSGFQKRLVDTGLFQEVGVNYYTLNQVGPISISGTTTPEKLKEALAALDREIAQFDKPGYLTAAELEPVKRQRAVETAMGLERASGLAHTIGFWWSVASLDYFMGYIDNMAKQTTADLRSYASKYIVAKPRVVGVMIDPESRARIHLTEADLLAAGGK
ncbi:MAG: insulinase family protein [Gemmatimonadaceae bacterium]|nr:insulinase family protein [Gemmatimonadaceae bacterium]NUQ94937.1 insulinase family protein [Gemmatimonadaceae bacterium]NUR19778.1 insulinase family protein [Gemmatimonadaceae bacterium]NUS98744.1 insulinase family protein [Gemmatimonadaceae bacterium]